MPSASQLMEPRLPLPFSPPRLLGNGTPQRPRCRRRVPPFIALVVVVIVPQLLFGELVIDPSGSVRDAVRSTRQELLEPPEIARRGDWCADGHPLSDHDGDESGAQPFVDIDKAAQWLPPRQQRTKRIEKVGEGRCESEHDDATHQKGHGSL